MLLIIFGEWETNVRHSCGSSFPSSFRLTMLFATSNVCTCGTGESMPSRERAYFDKSFMSATRTVMQSLARPLTE